MNVYCNPQLIVILGHEFAQAPFGKQDGRMTSFYSFKTIIMRSYLLSLLVALLAVTGSLPVAAQEAYAVLTPDSTLTFYYDNQRTTHQNYERIYDMPKPGEPPAWQVIIMNSRQKSSTPCSTPPFPGSAQPAPAPGSHIASVCRTSKAYETLTPKTSPTWATCSIAAGH